MELTDGRAVEGVMVSSLRPCSLSPGQFVTVSASHDGSTTAFAPRPPITLQRGGSTNTLRKEMSCRTHRSTRSRIGGGGPAPHTTHTAIRCSTVGNYDIIGNNNRSSSSQPTEIRPLHPLAVMTRPAATNTDEQSCAVETRQSEAASLFAVSKPGHAISPTLEVEPRWCERWRP
jgi:hypothetical protein